jgi:hypothetical protein
MKTLTLIATIAISLTGSSVIHAQTASFSTPAPNKKVVRKNAAKAGARIDGAAVRAVRSGNPLQMINPAAPAEYGNGQDMVRREDNDPYQRPQGIKLFVVEF